MYFARVTKEIEYRPGAWRGTRVGIFESVDGSETQVGEYSRNYPSLFRTFYPFTRNGKDYALYSPEYTVTRILELPSCKDIGGEEPNSYGFCPVDFYVPSYIEREWLKGNRVGEKYVVNEPGEESLKASDHSRPATPVLYYPFGFVAGCVWGDDSSWKIQHLDLSQVEHGVIKRDDRFGYIKLADKLSLKDAIDLVDYNSDPSEDYSYSAIMSVQRRFDLRTGKLMEGE